MKKMKTVMAWLITIVMMMSYAALGETAEDMEIESILNRMTLEEKAGQMMVVSFRVWKEIPAETNKENATSENTKQTIPSVKITELNDEIRQCLRDYHFGGTLLFADNCRDAEQTLRLVADLQAANQAGGGLPLLVATDQEGGSVARLGFGTTGVGNMALTATDNPDYARQMASVYGEELGLLGIHADYAPVMDVNNNPNNPVIGVRSFSDDPETVAKFGAAFIDGLHSQGTIATLKHFPGHGNTDTDSHTGFPCIDCSYAELKEAELVPFQTAIDSGADMIMTAHIQFPQIETETCTSTSTGEQVYLPATMSKTILTDILRGDMGFEGVIVSDALDMAAISSYFTDEDVLKYTINAGVNMLILPIIYDTNLFQRNMDMVDTAVRLVESGEIDIERVNDSVRRILSLKKKYGLLNQTDFTVTDEQAAAAVNGAGSAEHRQSAWKIAEQALTLVKNENEAFPLDVKAGDKTLILFADSCASRVASGELAKQRLIEKGILPENAEITILVHTRENDAECRQAAREADHVILINRVYASACLNPNTGDGFSTAIFDQIIAERHEAEKTAIVISCQLPYDAGRFPDADAILLTYGSSVMRAVPPESGEGSAYVPNLPAAICACFGACDAPGILPVNLPKLNEQYQLTEEILDTSLEKALDFYDIEPLSDGETKSETYTLEQVVMLSRHNLRAPLSSNGSVPSELTPHPWINWTANSSELTLKGGIEEASMGQYFGKWLDQEGLFPENSIPEEGEVRFNAREKQRCRATARYFAAGLFPLADIEVEYPGDDKGTVDFMNPALHFYSDAYAEDATAQVAAMGGEGGFDGLAEQTRDVIRLIMDTVDMQDSEIYQSGKYGDLLTDGFGYKMEADKEPDITGAIKPVYQVADALILQYYEAPDAVDAAFGHALTEDDWAAIGRFMTTCLEMKHGAPLVALNITHPLLEELEGELKNDQRKLSYFCAHDCTVLGTLSALGAKLDALPDSIETKAPVGVKLMFERLRDQAGQAWYRVSLVYRSTEQIRSNEMLTLDNPPMKYVLTFEGVEANADGLIAADDLFSLFDRSIGALDEIENAYALDDAA